MSNLNEQDNIFTFNFGEDEINQEYREPIILIISQPYLDYKNKLETIKSDLEMISNIDYEFYSFVNMEEVESIQQRVDELLLEGENYYNQKCVEQGEEFDLDYSDEFIELSNRVSNVVNEAKEFSNSSDLKLNDNEPKLKYVYTNKLLNFEKRHIGSFVYLRENDGFFKSGLYFGGDKGWERLSNDSEVIAEPYEHVPLPLESEIEYMYNGNLQSFVPSNYEDIKPYVSIYNREHTEVGKYTVYFNLNYKDWSWSDGTNEEKCVVFEIKPAILDEPKVVLNKYTWSNGEDLPHVDKVYNYLNGEYVELILNKDFEVFTNTINSYIKISFINNYQGNDDIIVKYNIEKLPVELPYFKKNVFGYTGNEITVFPSNWDNIKIYCENIIGNTETLPGDYTCLFRLKQPDLYYWEGTENDSTSKELTYKIGTVIIPTPQWIVEDLNDVDYDGEYHEFYPSNWIEIEEYNVVNITNNIHKNAGDYEVKLELPNVGYQWSDGTTLPKTFVCKINKFIVDTPLWKKNIAGVFNGMPYYYIPSNWEDIKEYCTIKGEQEVYVGTYTTTISLKDKVNYGWELITDVITSEDQSEEWEILKASGMFISGPYLNGSFYVNDVIDCSVLYVDNTCQIKYNWYTNSTPDLINAEYKDTTIESSYLIKPEDVDKFIICEVEAIPQEGVSNYTGSTSTTVSRVKVQKMAIYNNLKFENNKYEDSVSVTQSVYYLPEVLGIIDNDDANIEYSIIQGSDIADLWDMYTNQVMIKGMGDVVIEVKVKNSSTYIYTPNTLRFTLHIYSTDVVMWGLYDKNNTPTEREMLLNGVIPDTCHTAQLKENDKGIHSCLFRKDFPYRTFTGEEQVYYGWYVLLPEEKLMLEIDENGVQMNVDELVVKNENDEPLRIENENQQKYYVYGKFNVGKMSDNWMLHILFK